MSLVPGKGFMGDATMASITFLNDAIYEVLDVFQTPFEVDGEEVWSDDLIDQKKTAPIFNRLANVEGWEKTKDSFGDKVFKCIPWMTGQYQVTLVRMKNGNLKLDVRNWFDPNASASGS